MFSKIKDREEELSLLEFVKREGAFNNELIASLKEFKVEIKSNGVLHKGKEKERLALIKRLEKENKQYREFYKKNLYKAEHTFDHHEYQFNEGIHERRKHLKENNDD